MPTTPLCHVNLFPDFSETIRPLRSSRSRSHPAPSPTISSDQYGSQCRVAILNGRKVEEQGTRRRESCAGKGIDTTSPRPARGLLVLIVDVTHTHLVHWKKIVLSDSPWYTSPFTTMQCPTLSLIIMFALKYTLSAINIDSLASCWLMLTCYIFYSFISTYT